MSGLQAHDGWKMAFAGCRQVSLIPTEEEYFQMNADLSHLYHLFLTLINQTVPPT